ncbi:glycerol kinase, partial [Aureobasidium melanogenum]|uniref:glycerol kinase n=1 Tax=Aureobasidium melanogenum (strain CBS 110374) TaxID=1043003 RepID=A0A074VKB4_AURM1
MRNPNSRFIIAVDQGTTSTRVALFDLQGDLIAFHQECFSQIRPQPSWHEQDPEELYNSVTNSLDKCLNKFLEQGFRKDQITCLGVTNQRETTIAWDSTSGRPLYNATVWGDTRTKDMVTAAKKRHTHDDVVHKTGLPISTYSSALKLCWMLENVPAVKEAYQEGRLVFGTLDSWLIYKLNGGSERDLVVTDSTNASRTGFMDLSTRQYDRELLEFYTTPQYDLSRVRMPSIHPSADPVAYGSVRGGSLDGIPITGCVGDQSAALIGHRGFSVGSAKATYGTGCFCVYNTGSKIFDRQHGLLSTIAYDFGSEMAYALEGSIATAGSGVSFLVDNMGLAPNAAGISALADSVSDSGGVVFVTAFSGLFAPYWIDDARGTVFGITMKTQRGHIARAVLEAVCYQTKAAFDAALAYDDGLMLKTLNVDGGMSQSNNCMQLQADILGVDIVRPKMCEITALGACFTAGLGARIWNDTKEVDQIDLANNPEILRARRSDISGHEAFITWQKAVKMSRGWLSCC